MDNMIAIAIGCIFFLFLTGCFSRKKKWDKQAQEKWLYDQTHDRFGGRK